MSTSKRWWQDTAWNEATFTYLREIPDNKRYVLLERIVRPMEQSWPVPPEGQPQPNAIPGLLDLLGDPDAYDDKPFIDKYKKLAGSVAPGWSISSQYLCQELILQSNNWTAEEADELFKMVTVNSDFDAGWENQTPDAATCFFSNHHLSNITVPDGGDWYNDVLIPSLLDYEPDETGRKLLNYTSMSRIIANPGTSKANLDELAAFVNAEAGAYAHGKKNSVVLRSRSLLARIEEEKEVQDRWDDPRWNWSWMVAPGQEQVARAKVRERIVAQDWDALSYAMPLVGAVVDEAFENLGLEPGTVPVEWAVEAVS